MSVIELERTEAQLFERWLPASLEPWLRSGAASKLPDCSLEVTLGDSRWGLLFADRNLRVVAGALPDATFRLQMNEPARGELLARWQAAESVPGVERFLSRLDAELCQLASNIAGSLRLTARAENATLEVSFGPGRADFESPACVLSCELADLERVRRGETSAMDLFMNGKLTLTGNAEIALTLGGLLLG